LAFGAGAPDIFASLSASEEATQAGVQMGLAVLLGSSLFILAIVTPAVLLTCPNPIKLKKGFFIRDTVFLIASECLLAVAVLIRQNIDKLMSALFLALYAVYVVVVLVQDYYYKRHSVASQ